jgi:hypothetical protein
MFSAVNLLVSNGRMADQSESILKKKRGRGVIEILYRHLFRMTEENYEIPQDTLCPAEIEKNKSLGRYCCKKPIDINIPVLFIL